MDPTLNRVGTAGARRVRRACAALLAACTLGTAGAAPGADLPDPMSPTPGGRAAGTVPAAGTDTAAAPPPAAQDGPRLLSIRQPAGGRASALIGDRWVAAGDRIDGWRVSAVEADEVRLQRDGERLALRLWPRSLSPSKEPAAATATQRTRNVR
jgi:hypothetical protein